VVKYFEKQYIICIQTIKLKEDIVSNDRNKVARKYIFITKVG